jgi:cysteine desulfurase
MTVYLDYNATAPMHDAVIEMMTAILRETGNASSVHQFGRRARSHIETARRDVAALVGARAQNVVFTGGGTEANNLALASSSGRRLIVSATEHVSVLQAAVKVEIAPVDALGRIDLGALEALLAMGEGPAMVSVMAANNETGVLQPIPEIANLVHAHGALLHSDFIQAAGRVELDMNRNGVDVASLSAHKIGGPQGVGALIMRDDAAPAPLIRGGGQERGHRAGTENVAGIAGFGIAAGLAGSAVGNMAAVAALRDDLERRAVEMAPTAVVIAQDAPRLPNTSCLAVPGVKAETQIMGLDLAGVAVSAGSACSSGKVQSSHVLSAMGVDAATADSAIRISLGTATTAADIDGFLDAWGSFVRRVVKRDAPSGSMPVGKMPVGKMTDA